MAGGDGLFEHWHGARFVVEVWRQVALDGDDGLEADQIGGKPMGVPKTGIFGLIDLVGVDLMPLLTKSLTSTLPAGA